MLSLPIAFSSAIGVFAPVFSRPVWQHVKVLMTGCDPQNYRCLTDIERP